MSNHDKAASVKSWVASQASKHLPREVIEEGAQIAGKSAIDAAVKRLGHHAGRGVRQAATYGGIGAVAGGAKAVGSGEDVRAGAAKGALGGLAGGAVGRAFGANKALLGAGAGGLVPKTAGVDFVTETLSILKQAGMKEKIKGRFDEVRKNPGQFIRDMMGSSTMRKGEQEYTYTPIAGGSSVLPTGRVTDQANINLLPSHRVSPNIGIGEGGLQLGIAERRPGAVPKDSVIGKGLSKQRMDGGGVEVDVKPDPGKIKKKGKDEDWLMGHDKLNPNWDKAPSVTPSKQTLVKSALMVGSILKR